MKWPRVYVEFNCNGTLGIYHNKGSKFFKLEAPETWSDVASFKEYSSLKYMIKGYGNYNNRVRILSDKEVEQLKIKLL